MSDELSPISKVPPTAVAVEPRPVQPGPEAKVHTDRDVPPPSPGAAAQAEPSPVHSAVEHANRVLTTVSPGIRFSVDEETKKVVVQITNQETGEVIRQIPTEAQVAISASLGRLLGLLLSRKV